MGTKQQRRRRGRSEWIEICERFESSGLSSSEFCERERLALSSLQRWRRRLNKSQFTELVPTTRPSAESWRLDVEIPGGVVLRFRG